MRPAYRKEIVFEMNNRGDRPESRFLPPEGVACSASTTPDIREENVETIRKLSSSRLLAFLASLTMSMISGLACAQAMQEVLGAGDTVRIAVFRYPDLTTEARLTEHGKVNVPLIGQVTLQGMTPEQAARHIADRMKSGNYVLNPQIDVAVLQARSRQVSVLGFVTRPGRYMLEGKTAKVTDVIAMAGGLVPDASDWAVLHLNRDGKSESLYVDLASIIRGVDKNIELASGDSLFVPKAPVVYVYGEVTRGGSYRLEAGMTVMQAISLAGGVTPRGSERRAQLRRRGADGQWTEMSANPLDPVSPNDVIYIRESLF
jgi:polysaccharide export outer membrane protein